MKLTDRQILESAIAGDRGALASLLEEAGLKLHAELATRIHPRFRAEFDVDDILQVTFTEAFLRIREFEPAHDGAFHAWLRHIAENNLRDAIKHLERDKRPPAGRRLTEPVGEDSYAPLVERLAITTTTASRALVRSELISCVDEALSRLPEDYETALRLYEIEGFSGEEVAERMNRSHGAVRMLLSRARECLADLLRKTPHFSSSA
ncbi:MAG: sigma-70 family RNA polymerase sigma factor [Phycisphaerales bacterium]|nr:sigma-70 family RNA polymerase sigma factor [Phycisphaerales bacterium]